MGITVSDRGACVWKAVCSYTFTDSYDIPSPAAGTAEADANPEVLFGENYARLQRLKKQYDPDLVFFKWFPITPQA